MLSAIAALGVSLSLDDFGTLSSLSHLARMPVNEVKIDRSFVLGLESDPEFARWYARRSIWAMPSTQGGCRRHRDEDSARVCAVSAGYRQAISMRSHAAAQLEAWLVGKERIPVIAVPVDSRSTK